MRSGACMVPRRESLALDDSHHWSMHREPCLLLGELVVVAARQLDAFRPFAFASGKVPLWAQQHGSAGRERVLIAF